MSDQNLTNHYNALWYKSLEKFNNNEFELDPLITSSTDNRRGMTLIARLNPEVNSQVQLLLRELQQLEPEQYYYPASDLHFTIMSIISCYSGFSLNKIAPATYVQLIQQALQELPPFTIHVKGITASPSCILLQGFPADDTLKEVRQRLRDTFQASELEQTMDKRYAIITAHSTVLRFKQPLRQPDTFVQKLLQFRDYDFGSTKVTALELVYNDWYQRQEHVQLLHHFPLLGNPLL